MDSSAPHGGLRGWIVWLTRIIYEITTPSPAVLFFIRSFGPGIPFRAQVDHNFSDSHQSRCEPTASQRWFYVILLAQMLCSGISGLPWLQWFLQTWREFLTAVSLQRMKGASNSGNAVDFPASPKFHCHRLITCCANMHQHHLTSTNIY